MIQEIERSTRLKLICNFLYLAICLLYVISVQVFFSSLITRILGTSITVLVFLYLLKVEIIPSINHINFI